MNVYTRPQYAVARERLTWAVRRLILANIFVFVVQLLVDIPLGYRVSPMSEFAPPGGPVAGLLAFQPGLFVSGLFWKPFTYQFLHAGLMHLFMNMLRFYVICGTGAVLATLIPWSMFGREVSVTGASGAVMAVLVAFAVINPERQFFLFPFPLPINARALVIIVIIMNLFWGLGKGSTTSVATHFGGMAVGYCYMKFTPIFRRWRLDQRRRNHTAENSVDVAGKMVDNIFKFEKRRRRR